MTIAKAKKHGSIKVSVVVPVYGVEAYLPECLDSLLAQTLREIEIIVVDDGSPDGCGAIIDEYAARDMRIRAIHQENTGYGGAVNHGLRLARGEYVGIVESDDWVEPEMYQRLYEKARQYDADVSKGSFYDCDWDAPHRKRMHSAHPREFLPAPEGVFCLADYPKIVMSHASIWSMIYRREFLRREGLTLVEAESSAYQDLVWMVQTLSRAERIVVVKQPLYNWRCQRPGNSSTQTGRRLLQMIAMSERAWSDLEATGKLAECKEEIAFHIFRVNCLFFYHIDWQYKAQYFDWLRRFVLRLRDDEQFCFRHFDYFHARRVHWLCNNDFVRMARHLYSWQIMRRTLVSKRLPRDFGGHWQVCLLGVQIGTAFDNNLYSWARIRVPRWVSKGNA